MTKAQHTRKLLDDLVDAEVRDGLYDRVPKPQPDWSTVGPELLEALNLARSYVSIISDGDSADLRRIDAAIARCEGRE